MKKKKILTKPFGHISIGDKHYVVEVVDDDDRRYKGLSRRTKLDDGFGMLFDMIDDDKHSFQMKETYIPLDMVFIGKYGQIVDYIPNVQPLTDGPYSPKSPCRFVLEVTGNDLKDQVSEGDLTRMKFFDTLDLAHAYKDKRQLQEQLLQYLNEAVNGKKLRREQTTTRKNTIRRRKTI